MAALAACAAILAEGGAATAEPREIWKGQPDDVYALAVSLDGKTLASLTHPPTGANVILWDLASGKKTATLTPDRQFGLGVAFTPDGKSLVTVGTRPLKEGEKPPYSLFHLTSAMVWDLATEKVRLTIDYPEGFGDAMITPDGKSLIALGWDAGRVLVYDLSTGKPSEPFDLDKGFKDVMAVALSPDGKTLAAASRTGGLVLWDVEKKAARVTIPPGPDNPSARVLAFSPDNKTLATADGGDGSVFLWDVASGKSAGRLDFDPRVTPIRVIAFSPDGKTVAVGGLRWGVGLWDLAAGAERGDFDGDIHAGIVECAVFTPDGKTLITGSSNKAIWFSDVPQGRPQSLKPAGKLTPWEAKQLEKVGKEEPKPQAPDK